MIPAPIGVGLEAHDGLAARWLQLCLERGLTVDIESVWTTDETDLPELGKRLSVHSESGYQQAIFEVESALARLRLTRGSLHVMVAARSQDVAADVLARVARLMPRSSSDDETSVSMTFWVGTSNGPRSFHRRISVPSWANVHDNYAADVSSQLEGLMHRFRPSHGGQLLLWHGPPGTGKTYALRALCAEWREWCKANYVVDPDRFFGEDAAYLLDVVTGTGYADDDDGNPWRLLIFEDTGELLSADARERSGQGLSRLLNVVDGLIGQGLRILVLVTTNEEITKLHPAVSRPGRCAANVHFDALSAEEAARWSAQRGLRAPAGRATLADLFALAEEFDPGERVVREIGFREPSAA